MRKKLNIIGLSLLGIIIALLIAELCSLIEIKSQTTAIDINSGKLRETRHYIGIEFSQTISDTAITPYLPSNESADWKNVRGLSGLTHTKRPHYDMGRIPYHVTMLGKHWEAENISTMERKQQARAMQSLWSKPDAAKLSWDYISKLYDPSYLVR